MKAEPLRQLVREFREEALDLSRMAVSMKDEEGDVALAEAFAKHECARRLLQRLEGSRSHV